MADMLLSCAMLDEKPGKEWMDCFLSESRALLHIFPPQALVTVIWGLALLHHLPKADWVERYLAAAYDALPALSPAQLAKVLWALATLDCRPRVDFIVQCLQLTEGKLEALDANAMAEFMWALDRFDTEGNKTWVRSFGAEARAKFVVSAGLSLLKLPVTGHARLLRPVRPRHKQ
eukprot:jgi/Chrzof1/8828/Cz03g25300.t1